MYASQPQDLPVLFRQALNAGDVESVVLLYEPQGIVVPDPNEVISGHDAIRSMVAGFLAQQPRFELHDVEAVQTGSLALIRSRWTVTTTDAAGASNETGIQTILVACQQSDGCWLVAIDRPVPFVTRAAGCP